MYFGFPKCDQKVEKSDILTDVLCFYRIHDRLIVCMHTFWTVDKKSEWKAVSKPPSEAGGHLKTCSG